MPALGPGSEESHPVPSSPPRSPATLHRGALGALRPPAPANPAGPSTCTCIRVPVCPAVLPAAPQGFAANLAPGSHRRCHGAVGKSGSVRSFNICKVCLPGLTGPDPAARGGCRGPTAPRHHTTPSPHAAAAAQSLSPPAGPRCSRQPPCADSRVHRGSSNTSYLWQQL